MKIIISESQYNRIINEQSLNNPEKIKLFQDWMDKTHPNWINGKSLNKGKGYGNFGPNTTKAWNSYAKEFNSNTQSSTQPTKITPSAQPQTTKTGVTKVQLNTKIYNPNEFNSNAQQIADRLRQHGIPEKSILAILGNLYIESRFKVNAIGDTRLKGGASVGIAQWREERKKNLINYAKKLKQDPNQIWVQVDFLIDEMKNQRIYRPTWDAVMNPNTSMSDTAKIFTHNFERPANAGREGEKRAQVASQMAIAHPDKFNIKTQTT